MSTKLVPRIVEQRFYSTALVKTVPVVTVPLYIKQHVERQKRNEKLKLLQVVKVQPIGGNKAFPLITGQKSDFNFYLGQRYPEHRRIPLISEHWMKKNTSGQKFTIHKQNKNPSLPVIFNRVGIDHNFEFSQFGLQEEIVESLKNQGIVYPTPPQTEVIPEIMENKNVLFVAESGAGKTMAFVIPILQSICSLKGKIPRQTNAPLAVVVVPGKELAEQIAEQAYSVAEPCGVDVRVLVSGGTKREYLVPKDNTNVDILVGTVGTLRKLFKQKVFSMYNLRHVVVDEADTLLDDSFSEVLLRFLEYVMARSDEAHSDLMTPKAQLVVVSSIWPTNFDQALCELLPMEDVKRVVSPHAHRLMPHITHKFWRVRDAVKPGVLLELVKADVSRKLPVMIFSNRSQACDWMSDFLETNGVPNAKFHSGMTIQTRTASYNKFREGIVDALCCTDLASRGLDAQWVRHIINFDSPHNMSDYIHRAGRIGRVGSNHGHITNLVNSVPGAAVVQQIEMATRKLTGLSAIDTNIKRKIEKLKLITQYSP